MGSIDRNLIKFSGIADKLPENALCFKEFNLQEILSISEENPPIKQIISGMAQILINSKRIIKTEIGESQEGQILTGHKLIVEGDVKFKVQYTAEESTQRVYAVDFKIPFSNFIVLPSEFKVGTGINAIGYLEDIYMKKLENNNIFTNIIIFLEAKLLEDNF